MAGLTISLKVRKRCDGGQKMAKNSNTELSTRYISYKFCGTSNIVLMLLTAQKIQDLTREELSDNKIQYFVHLLIHI
jgi:predicted lactoylglutathione lyase